MPTVTRTMTLFLCARCDHEWVPRDVNDPPSVCPACKNPYWNRPRINPDSKQPLAKKRGKRKRAKKA